MIEPDLRDIILARPERLLEDRHVMNALVGANERAMGSNIVDLRGIAMQRLETRLDQLEDTHRSVIAAAYENLAGTNQVHRAVLQLLEPDTFAGFITGLATDVARTLRVDFVRLILETVQEDGASDPALHRLGETVQVAARGFVGNYLTNGRNGPSRAVVLRATTALAASVYGPRVEDIRSEAVMRLDLGHGRLPAALVFGSEDPHQFKALHGTDLLAFFAGAFERSMRQWLK
ncbi:MAG: recombinase XerC [Rhodobacterales bacterium 32-66-7]|nr:MAG: recombinase XerC [Rhodobacterales bacterium 32-66-7]